jgi:hypothetical protein
MTVLRIVVAAAVAALCLGATAAGAVGEVLIGLWNVPDDAGTLEIKDGGSFVGVVKEDGSQFAGKWEVGAGGVLKLVRDDGLAAECKYAVAGNTLTLADCPLLGEYTKAE